LPERGSDDLARLVQLQGDTAARAPAMLSLLLTPKARIPLLVAVLFVTGCASTKDIQRKEAFTTATPFSTTIELPSKVVCWSVKRAFLAQGYMLDRATAESATLTGVKEFQSDDETNVTLRLQTSCADNSNGTTTVYATALKEVNQVQEEKQHRALGVGWATVTVPAGSAKVLRPISRETIKEPEFYQRFYALVAKLAQEDARKAR
jgi:hypothetical protein